MYNLCFMIYQYFHATNSLLHLILQTFWVMLRWERLLIGYPSNHLRGCSALPTNWASQKGSSQRRDREGPSRIWSSSCCSSGNGGAQSTQSNHWHYWLWAVDTTLKHCDWIRPVCFGVLQSFFTVRKSHSIILHNYSILPLRACILSHHQNYYDALSTRTTHAYDASHYAKRHCPCTWCRWQSLLI